MSVASIRQHRPDCGSRSDTSQDDPRRRSTHRHFVGYVDGRSNYIQSAQTVFSKDFSGCLMVAYTRAGQRRVAHAAASVIQTMDCKQAFLNKIRGQGAVWAGGGWFRPFVSARDSGRKVAAFAVVGQYIGQVINNLTTFGVVTNGNRAYSIDAFKPIGIAGNDWVITDITNHALSELWYVPA